MVDPAEHYITLIDNPKFIVTQGTKRDPYEVATYYPYRGGNRNGMDPIPMFSEYITREQAQTFANDLPAMKRFLQKKIREDEAAGRR